MVARREVVDSLADLDDDTGAFVAAEDRERRHRDVAGDDVVIGVAHARHFERDLDLALARVTDLDLLDRPRLMEIPDERTF